ncbi:phosphate signaling complex protein PhoU [Spirochaetia bacterium 38H-sp]|uniref:Phosphate-specific transport system accessory protein PhoU n=1 Tax=Rarispira pelagica TaxID=3141764 RepID=A0ABU9UC70_9SPIR
MVNKLEEEIVILRDNIFKMGLEVEEALKLALAALKEKNTAACDSVFEHEERINRMQVELEDFCAQLLASYTPVASDLREILTSFKLISNIERIGDHAVHFAKALIRLNNKELLDEFGQFFYMLEVGIDMLDTALKAYVEQDANLARETASRDEKIDTMHNELLSHLFELIKKNPELAQDFTSLLFLNRFMERLGDHVTNICEWVVYSVTNRHEDLN